MSLDELRAQALEGAQKVSEGRFRIDADRALKKLRDFRLVDPHLYVLELLRAAVASGATAVNVTVDATVFELHFDGAPIAPKTLQELLSHALTAGDAQDGERNRLLAFGVAGALGLRPHAVQLFSGGALLEVREDGVTFEPRAAKARAGITVRVQERVGLRALRDAILTPLEESLIRQHADRFPIPLTVNRRRVQPSEPKEERTIVVRQEDGAEVRVSLPNTQGPAQSLVRFDLLGCAVVTRPLRLPLLQASIHVRDDSLRRNASGSDVVEDPHYVKLLALVRATHLEAVLAWVAAAPKSEERRGELYKRVVELARARQWDTLPQALREAVDAVPLLPGPAGEHVSIQALRDEVKKGRGIRYSKRTQPEGTYTPPAVLLDGYRPELHLLLPAPPRTDVQQEVDARVRGVRERRRWEREPTEALTLRGAYVARGPFHIHRYRGELGFLTGQRESVARVLHGQRLVAQVNLPRLAPLRLEAVIDVESALPDSAWSGLPESLATDELQRALIAAAVEVMGTALARPSPPAALREHAQELLCVLVREGRTLADLPEALREGWIFETAGGSLLSLSALSQLGELRHVPFSSPKPSLSGHVVVVITEAVREPLRRLLGRVRWIPYSDQLRAEQEVHERLAGPRRAPVLADRPLVAVRIEGEGMLGEVGIPRKPRPNLELVLLRQGVQLEIAEARTRFGGLVAVVECPELTPEDGWRRVKRDAVMGKILSAVQDAERRLISQIVAPAQGEAGALAALPRPVLAYLLSFLRKEVGPGKKVEALHQEVLEARMLPTSQGLSSMAELAAAFGTRGVLPWLERPDPALETSALRVLVLEREAAVVIAAALGLSLEGAEQELARLRRRVAFQSLPRTAAVVSAPLPVRTSVNQPHVTGEIAFAPERAPGCEATILFDGRVLEHRLIASPLPLLATLELRDRPVDPGIELPADRVSQLVAAVSAGEAALVREAMAAPEEANLRVLLLTAVRYALDERLTASAREALLALPLFPTVQGKACSTRQLSGTKRLAYVTESLEGTPRSKELIVVATERSVRSALERFSGRLVDVTDAVRLELYARQKRARIPQVGRVAVEAPALARAPLSGHDGEVALLPSAASLQIFQDRRLLCHIQPPQWPGCVGAAVEAPELEPTPDHTSVIRDAAYRALCEQLLSAADVLAEAVPAAFEALGPSERERWAPVVARLAFWSAGRDRKAPGLLALPVLEATDGAALSVRELMHEQKEHRHVRWSHLTQKGAADRVWRPRLGETELAAALRWALKDATSELRAAAERRARARLHTLKVEDSRSPWRTTLREEGLEGEVVFELPQRDQLRLELVKDGTLVDVVELPVPFGGLARIQSPTLTPNAQWTKVTRNQAYRRVCEAAEAALEALAYTCLAKSPPGEVRPLAVAVLRHRLGAADDLGPLLAKQPLFTLLGGGTATVGQVLAEKSRAGDVAVAAPHLAHAGERLVLEDTPANREVLTLLNCRVDDLSAQLRREAELERLRSTRRLTALTWEGDVLVRLEVDDEGYRGQLVLPLDPDREGGIRLARDLVVVDTFRDRDGLVSGVLSHPALLVNSDWSKAILTGEVRSFLQSRIDALLSLMISRLPGMNDDQRDLAATYGLRFLAGTGVKNAAGLERLQGIAAELSRQPFFQSADGRRVDLLTLADRVRSGRPLAIVRRELLRRGEGGDLAVTARFTNARWVRLLSQLLGGGLRTIDEPAQWEIWTKEGDPEESTPLGRGLVRLRREVRLLRADAFGQLGMKELSDVRLRPGNGKRPLHYDAKRSVALLDPENAEVRRALEEADARPDRLFVLLGGIYGAVNRALRDVTDADEARLAAALLGHLASNPNALRPK